MLIVGRCQGPAGADCSATCAADAARLEVVEAGGGVRRRLVSGAYQQGSPLIIFNLEGFSR